MGVRGLTTFLNEKPEKYFKKHLLRNCFVVVDGNCLAAVLWIKECGRTGVFGGDYDKLGWAVTTWVSELKKAGVCPLIIFDGGYEKHKRRTVIRRMQAKVSAMAGACPLGGGSHAFPLLLRQVVRDAAIKAGVAVGQADLEADADLAALAKRLDSPVLSADSDFFLFGTQFAPLGKLEDKAELQADGSWALECRLFSGGPLPMSLLPLLAALLGNDFIARSALAPFRDRLGTLKRIKKKTALRVRAIVEWLQDETFDSALAKILEPIRKKKRTAVLKLLKFVINNYTRLETPLDKYILQDGMPGLSSNEEQSKDVLLKKLESESQKTEGNQSDDSECDVEDKEEDNETDSDKVNKEDEEDDASSEEGESSCGNEEENLKESSGEEIEIEGEEDMKVNFVCGAKQFRMVDKWPEWFLEHSRRGLLPPCLNTLLSLRSVFITPQVEDYSLPHAGSVAIPLVRVIAGIVLGSGICYYYARKGSSYGRIILRTKPPGPWGLKDIPDLDITTRRMIIDDILETPPEIKNLPADLQLFGAAVAYWIRKMKEPPVVSYHINALVLMLIAVYIFDSKLGHFRTKRPFMMRYGKMLKNIAKKSDCKSSEIGHSVKTLNDNENCESISKEETFIDSDSDVHSIEHDPFGINAVPIEEALQLWPEICEMYHTNPDLRTNFRAFRRIDVHAYAALQAILEQSIILNALLLNPYCHTQVHCLYNGTFVYNVSARLSRARDPVNSVAVLLKSTPHLLKIHSNVVNIFLPHLQQGVHYPGLRIRARKRNKKKKKSEVKINETEIEFSGDELHNSDLDFSDLENKFSVLAKIS